ncbi:hypothetical protein V6N13_078028 [Hibiscus sabdariffa]|uniref:Uncharacterized protein n=2 Tax=Hibiscus sabdariffa TaxID=183260 RepID=A0ABR2RMD5_9ROSI
MGLLFFLFLATTISDGSPAKETIPGDKVLLLGPGVDRAPGLSCLSWRLAVETNNLIDWDIVPGQCEDYVGHYMMGHQYRKDSSMVTDQAILHAQSLTLGRDGKDVWVFDIDETSLSNLPYYACHGFGAEPYDPKLKKEWELEGKAPALPETLKLYEKLLSLGIRVVFLTGKSEEMRNVTSKNLRQVGYHTWEKLILKATSYSGETAVAYKSSERGKLVKSGYRIVGNIGDQWSDISGTNPGNRTFKLPDPMYYVA